mgnify:CR=1 FL=1
MTEASPRLLIVEDDATFARTLQRSFERRGYEARVAGDPAAVETALEGFDPGYAVVDLRLGTASGLPVIARLHAADPAMLIVVLTGHGSIATAVESIKLGACHYLVKPSTTDDIEAAFGRTVGDVAMPVAERPTSLKMHEWELIQQTLVETDFNISETARRLRMHRRTLARKLQKKPFT